MTTAAVDTNLLLRRRRRGSTNRMDRLRRSLLLAAASSPLVGCAQSLLPSQPGACSSSHCELERLVSEVSAAAYRGQTRYLLELAFQLEPHVTKSAATADALYWRSFAFWLAATSLMQDKAPDADTDGTLAAALAGFEELLRQDAGNIEARIAIVGCHLNRVNLWRSASGFEPSVLGDSARRIRPLVAVLRRDAPRNLRAVWVVSTVQFASPDIAVREATVAQVRSALSQGDDDTPGPLRPRWGRPELLVALAWMLGELHRPNDESADLVQKALRLQPEWRYARQLAVQQARS